MSIKAISESLLISASQCWFSKAPTSQQDLVLQLKKAHLLRTPEVIDAMAQCDRSLFTLDQSPYENKPLNIGCEEVMTTPSTHALTLELLFPYFKSNSKVLDLGCGTGYLSQCFSSFTQKGSVLGVDFHRDLIQKASKINRFPNLQFRHCDAFEIIEDFFDIINVGFAATEELYKQLVEKANNGILLCPVIRNNVIWVVNVEGKEEVIGEVGFSGMRVKLNLEEDLKEIDNKIKEIYENTQKKLGKKPTIADLPIEIHEILKKRRRIDALIKRREQNKLMANNS